MPVSGTASTVYRTINRAKQVKEGVSVTTGYRTIKRARAQTEGSA